MGSSTKLRKKTDKSPDPNNISLEEHLARAQDAVQRNQESVLTLHYQWRTQLLRMSYLVMIVTLHIAQTLSSACIKDIKKWNQIQTESGFSTTISGIEAIFLILHDSVVELISILCTAFLVWCLSLPMKGNDFSTIPYRLSCTVIPMIVTLHFHRKSQANMDMDILSSCVSAASIFTNNPSTLTLQDLRGVDDTSSQPIKRHFPVILVFHSIVSIGLWFMQFQRGQHEKNLGMVEKLKQDLLEAKKAKLDRKKR